MSVASHHSGDAIRRVAVMQPYLFPYFPYIQLIACVDVFIIFDTAQFIARGWANRNFIKVEERLHRFVVPVRKAPRDTAFADMCFAHNVDLAVMRMHQTLHHAQRSSRFPDAPRQLLSATFGPHAAAGSSFIAAFERMAVHLMKILSFDTQIVRASSLGPREDGPAENCIIRMVKQVGGSEYVNPIGGAEMYDRARFAEHGLGLSFLRSTAETDQSSSEANGLDLSILDSLAHYPPADLRRRLADYMLVV